MQAPTSNTPLSPQEQNIDFDSLLEKQRELLKQIREKPEDVNTKFGLTLMVAPPSPTTSHVHQQHQHQQQTGPTIAPIVAHGWTFERVRRPSGKPPLAPSNGMTNPTVGGAGAGKKSKRQRRQERQEAEEWISNWHFERIPPGGSGAAAGAGASHFGHPRAVPSCPETGVGSGTESTGRDDESSDDAASRASDTPQWFFERVPATTAPSRTRKVIDVDDDDDDDDDDVVHVTAPHHGLPLDVYKDDVHDDIINDDHEASDNDDNDVVMEMIMDGEGDDNDKIIDGIDDSFHHHPHQHHHLMHGVDRPSHGDDDVIDGLEEGVIADDISLEDLVVDDEDEEDDEDNDVMMTLEDEGLLPPQYLEELKHLQTATRHMDEVGGHRQLEGPAIPGTTYRAKYQNHQVPPSAVPSFATEVKVSVRSTEEEDDVVMGQDGQRMETPDSSNHSPSSVTGQVASAAPPTQSNLSPTSVMTMNGPSVPYLHHSSSKTLLPPTSVGSVRLPCAEGMDEMFKSTLQKLTESMKRSAESRQSLLIKTEHTQEYGRSLCVNQILQSVQSSSRQVDTCLEMYRMPTTTTTTTTSKAFGGTTSVTPEVAIPTPVRSLSSMSMNEPTKSSLAVAAAAAIVQ